MKNKFILLLCAFVLSTNIGSAQPQGFNAKNKGKSFNYLPIANEGAVWLETYYVDTSPSPYGFNGAQTKHIDGDTIINNITYKKIICTHIDMFCQSMIIDRCYGDFIRIIIN
jgi:hypothetical protein